MTVTSTEGRFSSSKNSVLKPAIENNLYIIDRVNIQVPNKMPKWKVKTLIPTIKFTLKGFNAVFSPALH